MVNLKKVNRLVEYDEKTNVAEIKVTYIEKVDIPKVLFGISLKEYGGVGALNNVLTESQMVMVNEIVRIVASEIENDTLQYYTTDKDGNGVVSKRYLADKIGMEEANFKQKLMRITDRVKRIHFK